MSTVISVDWDYFFPRLNEFDWGHHESPLHFETLWTPRTADISLVTLESAIDVMQPDSKLLEGFWEKVCPNGVRMLVVAESHRELLRLLELLEPDRVINYDHHHDYYYDKPPKNIKQMDCSNWGYFALRKKYTKRITWVYPPSLEIQLPKNIDKKFDIQNTPVLGIDHVSLLFICRSFAWTPTWADDKWIEFVGAWQELDPAIWESRLYAPSTLQVRHPTFDEAKEHRKMLRDILDNMMERSNKDV